MDKKNNFDIILTQPIYMSNLSTPIKLTKESIFLIQSSMYSLDDNTNDLIYRICTNSHDKKINTMKLILSHPIPIPLNNNYYTSNDIIKFFDWLGPLTIQTSFGSRNWNIKKIKYCNKQKILLQNSISKNNMGTNYNNFIDNIKNKLNISNIRYVYFEFKSKRFNKIKDIIWAFDL